jgi:signal transduction histidine kinase
LKGAARVSEPKELAISAIVRAQADLSEALTELEKIPAFEPGSVAFVAHALTNYLSVVGGTVELIQLHLANHTNGELKIWLEGLQHATNLISRTVGQLMNLSASVETQPRLEKFDLPSLVKRACNYYQRAANPKSIRLIFDSAADVPPVWADRVLIAAVLDNLVSNAVKYSPPEKQVWIHVRGEGSWAVCSVQDEGPGLSPEDQSKLFQKGGRLTPKPTGNEPSTGYGLAVAQILIRKLGGEIWCESVLGQGACFSFRVPVYPGPPPGAEASAPGANVESGDEKMGS